jgi:hypothetical protein
MKDITKAIQGANLTVWDEKTPGNSHWARHDLLDPSGANEKFRHTLYVHVIKNEEKYEIYDNNGKIGTPGGKKGTKNPNVIINPQSYMIKLGKTDHYADEKDKWKGIISRRQLDFKSHYHHRNDARITNTYKLSLADLKAFGLRTGSKPTKLHLLIELNDKTKTYITEQEGKLRELMRTEFNYNGVYAGATNITRDRINIPIASVLNERNFIEHVREVFERFEDTL